MSRPKILYIEDDLGIGRLVQKTLESRGFDVVLAESGAQGLALLRAEPFDVVALDHHMPGQTGLELIPDIRALPMPPPIVYVTGSDDSHVAVAALKLGALEYVWKDVQGHYRDLLVKAVKAALHQERMRREKEAADLEIRLARDRAELLLKEVNHRVANSLAIVAGLVGLQKSTVQDPSAHHLLEQMRARILAIAGVHRRLYTSDDISTVDLKEYLGSLVNDLKAAMVDEGRTHPINIDCVPVALPTDKAVSVGIIATELVTNAHKYAYPGTDQGSIRVSVRQTNGDVVLTVDDDGVGLQPNAASGGTGLGSKVIASMTARLQGEISRPKTPKGTRVVLQFPL
ncbi:two-component system sensor histidine kinase/response regulator [Hyphomicrobium methylovorum]|uniref:histidine kinase dimerization/phosphoacceptor domain -containing protein n=1 Tax=Hyphomicrobium methylovorum TaxID=84 RepID=UPI0015E6CE51|nr:histidine kinase dimerization/phosphoacceptor domain -containing protein [Hyphomicrobium methylovorum]MBA2126308.1 two-component system sensor histidine kinase/response regulator [Hyphomicrobium methylovorum]